MTDIKTYIDQNQQRFLDELFSLIRIPSISAESEHKEDMVKCANQWKKLILEIFIKILMNLKKKMSKKIKIKNNL